MYTKPKVNANMDRFLCVVWKNCLFVAMEISITSVLLHRASVSGSYSRYREKREVQEFSLSDFLSPNETQLLHRRGCGPQRFPLSQSPATA